MLIPDPLTAQQKDNIAYFIAFCLETYKKTSKPYILKVRNGF